MAAYQSAVLMPFISNGKCSDLFLLWWSRGHQFDRSRISFLFDNRTHRSDSYRIWKCGKKIYLLEGALSRKANPDNSSNGFRSTGIRMDRLYAQ
jgi:hypothetical protein